MVLSLLHFAKSYFIMKKLTIINHEKKSVFTKTNNKISKVNNKIKDFGCLNITNFLLIKISKIIMKKIWIFYYVYDKILV